MTTGNSHSPVRGSDGRFLPAAVRPATALSDIVAQAKAIAGDEWGTVRSWPLESGLVFLSEKLKG